MSVVEPGPIPKEEIEDIIRGGQDAATDAKEFRFIRTAYRVKDPRKSIKFYTDLGFTLLNSLDVPELKATLYSLGHVRPDEEIPSSTDVHKRNYWAMTRSATLELTYNWGTDKNSEFQYDLGTGYGNISIMVPDVRDATHRLQKLGVIFKKTPDEGTLKGLAFFSDPDGYVVEIYDKQAVEDNI